MSTSHWYLHALKVIRQTVDENPGLDPDALRAKVADAYPFGPRKHHPYKQWCKAVETILGPSEQKLRATQARIAADLQRLNPAQAAQRALELEDPE